MIIDKEEDNLKIMEIGSDCEVIPVFPLKSDVIKHVRYFDLSFNRLRNLNGLERYTHLETMILDNNSLSDDVYLPVLPDLKILSMNKNYICHLQGLLDLLRISTPKLEFLSLLNNPCCPNEMVNSCYTEEDYRRYRIKVIGNIPTLRFLDSKRVGQREKRAALPTPASKAESSGPLDQVVFDRSDFVEKTYSTARYGKVLVRYRGKHSEGNRFIRDTDL